MDPIPLEPLSAEQLASLKQSMPWIARPMIPVYQYGVKHGWSWQKYMAATFGASTVMAVGLWRAGFAVAGAVKGAIDQYVDTHPRSPVEVEQVAPARTLDTLVTPYGTYIVPHQKPRS